MSASTSRREWIIGASAFTAGVLASPVFKTVSRASKGSISGFDKSLRASIVKILITAPPAGAGSGFCISTGPDGRSVIATASHVVDGDRINRLVEDFSSNRVLAHDGAADPMRLPCCHENWMDVSAFHSELRLRPLTLAEDLPKIGSPIYALGFPGGGDYGVAVGRFTGLELDGNCRIQTSARIVRGFSGGPVVNTKGEVIGMAVTVLADGSASYCVPLHELRNLRERMSFVDAAVSR